MEPERDEVLEVVADALDEEVAEVPRVVGEEHDEEDEHAKPEAELTQQLQTQDRATSTMVAN